MSDPEVKKKIEKEKKKSVEENQHDKLQQLREENLRLKTEPGQINKELHALKAKFDINLLPLLGESSNVIKAEKSVAFVSSKYDNFLKFKTLVNKIH